MEYQMSFFRGQPDNEAIKMIQYFEPLALEMDERGYCVCSSEGKDSRVLGHLFRRAGVKHFYAHSITGIDPPELIYFQRKNFEEYRKSGYLTYEIMYDYSIWQLMMKKLMPPYRHKRYCCSELKEKRSEITQGCLFSFGVRKYESVNRLKKRNELEIAPAKRNENYIVMPYDDNENRRTFENCFKDHEKRLNPIAYWTDEDIWNYSLDVGLEQCSLYNEGFSRLGCIGCPMARKSGRKNEFERYPGFERLYRKTFSRMYSERVRQGKKLYWESSDYWYYCWLNDIRVPGEETDEFFQMSFAE